MGSVKNKHAYTERSEIENFRIACVVTEPGARQDQRDSDNYFPKIWHITKTARVWGLFMFSIGVAVGFLAALLLTLLAI